MTSRDIAYAALAVLLVSGVTYALATINPQTPPPPSPGQPAAKKVAGNVVMHVNGEPITEQEFELFVQQAPEQMQAFYLSPQGRPLLAQEFIKLKVLEQEGRKLGLDDDPQVQARVGMSRMNILAASALRKLVSEPTDASLRAEYEKEGKALETLELSHILIAYEGGGIPPRSGKAPSPEQAMKQAQTIVGRLRGGADFAALARSQSDDVDSAREGGLLGPVSPRALPPELRSAVENLAPGQISEPVRSQYGIHILKAGARRAEPFESVRQGLAARVERREMEQVVTRLQRAAKVEFDPKFFASGEKSSPAVNR